MTVIALATARTARELDEDLKPLESALRAQGAEVHCPAWDEPVDWGSFDVTVLRSTWDYTTRLPEFLDWAQRTSTRTRLLNPFPVIQWNTDKHYLADLAARGAPVVPTSFIEPREDPARELQTFLKETDCSEFVVKPAVGAGSRDAQRYSRTDSAIALEHAQRLLDENRSVVLQPYLDRVDEAGETALIFFEGRFSHSIRKGPLLRRGEGPTRALFAPEQITPRTASEDELRVAEQVLAACPFGTQLYARVDLLRDAGGKPCLLELELTEPSLFFEHGRGSVDTFARAILTRARGE